jgi:diguanylate cyclase (GGDEF)-like protein
VRLPNADGTAPNLLDSFARPEGGLIERRATPVLGVLAIASYGKRVLVVEDDAGVASALTALLQENGYQTETISNGADAVARARTLPPALLILDLGLPDRDGLAVATELAQDRRTAHVPILFLSGQENLAARIRSSRIVAYDFLRKPFGEVELLTRIERCLTDADSRARLRSDARIDELTGLGNARLLYERLDVEAARRERYGTPLTVAILDMDRLKKINDEHGHLTGSAVLGAVGTAIRAEIRETDVACRYGGDEFVVLLPHTGLEEGLTFAERLLGRIRALRPCDIPVSMSMGIATFDPALDGSVHAQLGRADAATYAAKRLGGNCIVAANAKH